MVFGVKYAMDGDLGGWGGPPRPWSSIALTALWSSVASPVPRRGCNPPLQDTQPFSYLTRHPGY